jgi:hypothetical protein
MCKALTKREKMELYMCKTEHEFEGQKIFFGQLFLVDSVYDLPGNSNGDVSWKFLLIKDGI